ncbi:MAG: hypothetical protein QM770_13820 [Tepidisphaeraceae bacterium]
MSQNTALIPVSVSRLIEVLKAQFGPSVGAIWDDATKDPVYTLYVESPRFAGMSPMEAQDLVWDIAYRELDRDERALVSLILTFAPDDRKSAVPA